MSIEYLLDIAPALFNAVVGDGLGGNCRCGFSRWRTDLLASLFGNDAYFLPLFYIQQLGA